jgi:FAD/FMN-containing dehydrogenase
MVLFGDIAGDDADAVARPHQRWCALPTHVMVKVLWRSALRRAKSSGWTANARPPSAKHTNAFKINEDVVIPLPRMAEYTDGIERINIELSLQNKLALCDALTRFFQPGPTAARAPGRCQRDIGHRIAGRPSCASAER